MCKTDRWVGGSEFAGELLEAVDTAGAEHEVATERRKLTRCTTDECRQR
jgi:hypothetical protein